MKHAYLIIAHDRPAELGALIDALDYPGNEIFLHIDAKSTMNLRPFIGRTKYSPLNFIDRRSVSWGGNSQIEVELDLFEAAYKQGNYRYFHMLSGIDYPVKSQPYIQSYFERYDGENFISLKDADDSSANFKMRFQQYHFLQDSLIGKKRNFWKYVDFASCYLQRAVGVERFKGRPMKRHINWISVTDDVVSLLVENRARISREYRWTYCCDEVFVLSEIWNTPLKDTISSRGNLRYIQWKQFGPHDCSPKVLTEEDLPFLESPDILFARKFTLPASEKLYRELQKRMDNDNASS